MRRSAKTERCTSRVSPKCTGKATPRDLENGGMYKPRGGLPICEHCDLHGMEYKPQRATDYLEGRSSLAEFDGMDGRGVHPTPEEMIRIDANLKEMGILYDHESQKNYFFAGMTPRQ